MSGTLNRSLVVTSSTILKDFTFERVMERIRMTAGANQTNTQIFQAWMRTFGAGSPGGCHDKTIDPNRYDMTCPRPPEASLASVDPFAAGSKYTFKPVGLVNRIDLMPDSGANCGEYRMVFALHSTDPDDRSRGFIIFEAVIPNPMPSAGKAACLPIARFWQDLSNDPVDTSRAAKLDHFFFSNTPLPAFPAMVSAGHYGLASGATAAFGLGRVRTNFFVNGVEWQLREFQPRRICTGTAAGSCTMRFEQVTAKNNPADKLFDDRSPKSAAFRTAFVRSVQRLASNTLNNIGMEIDDDFNKFESVANPPATAVNYPQLANRALLNAIQAKLAELRSPLTAANILARAETQTCAGCHRASSNAQLGGGLTWPRAETKSGELLFVHIDESGTLSPVLSTVFLPARAAVLEKLINDSCEPKAVAGTTRQFDSPTQPSGGPALTIGGSVVGAPN